MKRLPTILLTLTLALSLSACGGQQDSQSGDSGVTGRPQATAPSTESGEGGGAEIPAPKAGSSLVFTYRNCPLPMNAEFAPLLEYLGEPDSYFEATSCAFDGLDKTYTYAGMELITYPDEDKDYISSIRLLDSSAATPEGITIGSSEEEVIAAYGTDYQELGQQYAYEDGDAILTVLFEDGAAISVEYVAVNDLLG